MIIMAILPIILLPREYERTSSGNNNDNDDNEVVHDYYGKQFEVILLLYFK